jgi:hypothetical protein
MPEDTEDLTLDERFTDLKALLERPPCHVSLYASPHELPKFVRRLRKVKLYVKVELELVTERDEAAGTYRCFDESCYLPVSAMQMQIVLATAVDKNVRLEKSGKLPGRLRVSRSGDCFFVG